MIYRNESKSTKTYHGVTFKPGEVKSCPSYINDFSFKRLPDDFLESEPVSVAEVVEDVEPKAAKPAAKTTTKTAKTTTKSDKASKKEVSSDTKPTKEEEING